MARLAQYMKDSIIQRAIAHAYGVRQEVLRKEKTELALEFYNDVYPADVREKMAALPEGFLRTSSTMKVSIGGKTSLLDLSLSRRMCKRSEHNQHKVYDGAHPLSEKFWEFKCREEDLDAEIAKAKAGLKALLGSVSTVEALLKIWPEGEDFAGEYRGSKHSVSLPSVVVHDLNKMLNLYKKDDEK